MSNPELEQKRITELEAQIEALKENKDTLIDKLSETLHRAVNAEAQIESLQAKIDALMLEYCPEEMTEQQMKTWGNNQKSSEGGK